MLGLNPWFILISVLAVIASGGGLYLKGRGDGQAIERSQQLTQAAIREETLKTAQQGAAVEISKIQVTHVTTRQQLETRIIERPDYSKCVADDGVFALTNQAITGAQLPASGSIVPPAGGDDGKDVR